MILWKSKETPFNDPYDAGARLLKTRRVLEVTLNRDYFTLEWGRQYVLRGDEEEKWRDAYDGLSLVLSRSWLWGHNHMWYDGPNCNFSLGFLKINWSSPGCKRCHSDLNDDK
jgi:hypothetical protein